MYGGISPINKFDLINHGLDKIKTYEQLKSKILRKDGSVIGKCKGYYSFLEKIRKETNTDPVLILYNQIKGGMTCEIIGNKFGRDKNRIWYLLTNVFNWELINSNERTESSVKRREKSKNVDGLTKQWKKVHLETSDKYKKNTDNILHWYENEEKKVDFEHFNKLNGKYRKIIYLISLLYKKTIEGSIGIIKSLNESGSSNYIISERLKCELETLTKENSGLFIDIKIDDIRYICEKYSYEKYKEEELNELEVGEIDDNIKVGDSFKLDYRLSNVIGITSRKELDELQEKTPEHSKRKLQNRLNKLALTLKTIYKNERNIDPIHFYIHLFYEKGYNPKEISMYLEKIGIIWPKSTIENLIKILKWEKNEIDSKKIEIKLFNEEIEEISMNAYKNVDIDIKYFNSLNGKNRKILYIISIFYKIPIEKSIKLIKQLKEKKLSAGFIAEILNKKFKYLYQENPEMNLKIIDRDISCIIKNYDYPKYISGEEKISDFQELKSENKFEPKYNLFEMEGITTRKDLEETLTSGPKDKLKERLDNLSIAINKKYPNQGIIDPITYLKYLYYEKGYLMGKISRYLNEIGIIWPASSLKPLRIKLLWGSNIKK